MSKLKELEINKDVIGKIMRSDAMMEYLQEVASEHGEIYNSFVGPTRCNVGVINPDEALQNVAHY